MNLASCGKWINLTSRRILKNTRNAIVCVEENFKSKASSYYDNQVVLTLSQSMTIRQ